MNVEYYATPDHASAVGIAIAAAFVVLLAGYLARRAQPMLAARVGERIALYAMLAVRHTVLMAGIITILWCLELASGRRNFIAALSDVGLDADFAYDAAAVLTVAMVAATAAISAAISLLRQSLGGSPTQEAAALLPQTPAETAFFCLVLAPMSGASEEIIFRGVLIVQIWHFTGSDWMTLVLSSSLFGLMHAYQGVWGVVRTALIGFVFALGVLLTGSILVSIAAHILSNVLGAAFSFRADKVSSS